MVPKPCLWPWPFFAILFFDHCSILKTHFGSEPEAAVPGGLHVGGGPDGANMNNLEPSVGKKWSLVFARDIILVVKFLFTYYSCLATYTPANMQAKQ